MAEQARLPTEPQVLRKASARFLKAELDPPAGSATRPANTAGGSPQAEGTRLGPWRSTATHEAVKQQEALAPRSRAQVRTLGRSRGRLTPGAKLAEVDPQVVRPDHEGEDRLPPQELREGEGEEPSREPEHPRPLPSHPNVAM